MTKSVDTTYCINKNLFNDLLLVTNYSSDIYLDENKDNYLIEKNIFDKIVSEFNKIFKEKELALPKNQKGISYSVYDELNNEYNEIKYNSIRNDFNQINNGKITDEEKLALKIKIYKEMENINSIPEYIEYIKNELNEIKTNELSENINSYISRYRSLLNNGGLLIDYMNLKNELDSIIKKTYLDNIVIDTNDNKNMFLVKNGSEYKILSYENISDFSYGYVYSASSIKRVSNNSDNSFVCLYNINYDSYKIDIKEDKPIGVYAVTFGEKSINPNYNKAQEICSYTRLPFIELDKTLMNLTSNVDFKELIDNLLNDKGVIIENKDEYFYEKFIPFYNKFLSLKKNGYKGYDEGNIVNLFDFYFNVIFSQRYLDLNILLDDRNSVEVVREILSNNIYYDFNIFKNKLVTKDILNKFINKFDSVKSNRLLNMAYPGIENIINEINKANENKILEIIETINSTPCRDSWLIYQLIKSNQLANKTSAKVTKLSYIKEEKEQLNGLINLLKSQDDYSR